VRSACLSVVCLSTICPSYICLSVCLSSICLSSAFLLSSATSPPTPCLESPCFERDDVDTAATDVPSVHVTRSDPTHASGKYGEWYTRQQIIDLFAPSDESIAKVKEWLLLSGVAAESIVVPATRGWVHFDATVGQLESLVKADYHIYNHVRARDDGDGGDGEGSHLGTDAYHLPEEVAAHVDFIVPGTAFGRLSPGKSLRRRKLGAGGKGSRPLEPIQAEIQSNPGA